MIFEVRNLMTHERKPVLAPSPSIAVAIAAAEDRYPGNPFRELREAFRLRREVRSGRKTVFCGNWMTDRP